MANGMPLGSIIWFSTSTAPDGWLEANGAEVTSAYGDLRSFLLAAGSPYGTANGNPLLPDLRGNFVRGWDNGRGVDDGRTFASFQQDQMQRITGAFESAFGSRGETQQRLDDDNDTEGAFDHETGSLSGASGSASLSTRFTFDSADSPGARAGDETRPRNVALLPCIKAYSAASGGSGADLNGVFVSVATAEDITGSKNFAGARLSSSVQSIASSANIAIDAATGNRFEVTLAQNATVANPSNLSANGQSIMLILRQDGTGSRTVTWGSAWKFPGAVAPVLTTVGGSIDVVIGEVIDSDTILCNAILNFG